MEQSNKPQDGSSRMHRDNKGQNAKLQYIKIPQKRKPYIQKLNKYESGSISNEFNLLERVEGWSLLTNQKQAIAQLSDNVLLMYTISEMNNNQEEKTELNGEES